MKPFHKLLVPIDFSIPSKDALMVAADIARHYEAPITLIHVSQHELLSVPESFMLYDSSKLPALLEHLKQLLETERNTLRANGVLGVDTVLKQGVPATEIVRFAKDGNYDLIVMGTHGRAGMAHTLLGSVVERVTRTAPCAVLTIRESMKPPKQTPQTARN